LEKNVELGQTEFIQEFLENKAHYVLYVVIGQSCINCSMVRSKNTKQYVTPDYLRRP